MMRRMALTTLIAAILAIVWAMSLAAEVRSTESTIQHCIDGTVTLTDGMGHGSGWILDANTVVTAGHVAEHEGLTVTTQDGDIYEVVGSYVHPDCDAAVLTIDGTFDEVPLVWSVEELDVLDDVMLIATPFSKELIGSVLTGRVVNDDYDMEWWDLEGHHVYPDLVATDVHGGPGTSGGPLLKDGVVVGISVTQDNALTCVLPVGQFVEILK